MYDAASGGNTGTEGTGSLASPPPAAARSSFPRWIGMVVAPVGAGVSCLALVATLVWAAGAEEREARQVAEGVIRRIYQPDGAPPAGRIGHWDVEFPSSPQVQKCFPVRDGGGALWRVVGAVRGRPWQAPPPPGEADRYRVEYYCGLEGLGGGRYRIWQVVLDGSSESRLEGKVVSAQ